VERFAQDAVNKGVRIHFETIGNGWPLVLHHGLGGSGSDWIDLGYADALKDGHQVILVDGRGHGQNDKLHDTSAYDLAIRASDVVAVLDTLGHRTSDYFGYSLGGNTGYGLARYSPERISAFVIGGAHPYAENLQPFRDLVPQDQAAWAATVDKVFGSLVPPAWRDRLVANDLAALRAMTSRDRQSIADDVLPRMSMPCLLFAGETDPRLEAVRECASHLTNVTLFTLPGCDHIGTFAQTEIIIPRVRDQVARA
jgi:pimeloyl-ACP methyl ester carboxylesterase